MLHNTLGIVLVFSGIPGTACIKLFGGMLGNVSSSFFFWHLVLYFAFCALHALVTRGGTIQEPQYIFYFILMTLLSAVFSKLDERKRVAGTAAKHSV